MGQLNDMAARSVQTTRDKGFRGDWEDAEFLETMADELVWLSTKLYTPEEKRGDPSYPQGLESHRKQADRMRRIATQHRALLFGTKLALAMGECAEALEEIRDHGIDGVLAGGTKFGEELADVHIRLFDMEDLAGVDTEAAITAKQDKNDGRPHMHGRKF